MLWDSKVLICSGKTEGWDQRDPPPSLYCWTALDEIIFKIRLVPEIIRGIGSTATVSQKLLRTVSVVAVFRVFNFRLINRHGDRDHDRANPSFTNEVSLLNFYVQIRDHFNMR